MKSVSLVSVEELVLGLVRQDDLPGKEAPTRYFQYVNDRDPLVIQPVLEHNAMDVSSLVGILTGIADLMTGRAKPETAETYTALARYFTEWNDYDMAAKCYQAATEFEDATWATHWQKGMLLKRMGLIDEAKQVWEEMADMYPDSVAPLVELAKVAEHRDKDYKLAQKWAALALERYRNHYQAVKGSAQNGGNTGPLHIPYRVSQWKNAAAEGRGQNQDRSQSWGQSQSQNQLRSQGQGADVEALSEDRIFAELAHRLNRIICKGSEHG